ncbi:hypothetical protein [Rhodobacter xanthinilyticus]|nr:hypothetical protein [Rhodobacter xanthinilyticus]
MDSFTEIIDGWLEDDREVHRKKRHAATLVIAWPAHRRRKG